MVVRIITIVFFVLIFLGIVAYSRGYLRNQSILSATGLVAVTSTPSSAKVYANGKLLGTTDLHENLDPGSYTFTVVKEGYFPWQKTISLKGEVVQSLDAILYPLNSSLSPLTNIGIVKAIPIGTQSRRVLLLSDRIPAQDISPTPLVDETASDNQEGIFVYDPSQSVVSFLPNLQKILDYKDLDPDVDPKDIDVLFSPDFTQALIFELDPAISPKLTPGPRLSQSEFYPPYSIPSRYKKALYIRSLKELDLQPVDFTNSVDVLINTWTQDKVKNLDLLLSTYRKPSEIEFANFLKNTTRLIDISQDKTRILYEATASANLKPVLEDKLIGTNQTPEKRDTTPGSIYIYDIKEDKNYEVLNSSEASQKPDPFIHPNSKNIMYNELKSISVSDFDGMNKHKVYSGPYDSSFYSMTSDGRILILSNLNPELHQYGDLYAVGIR